MKTDIAIPIGLATSLLHQLQEDIEACGPCDHAVNICVCGVIAMADDLHKRITRFVEKQNKKSLEQLFPNLNP